MKRKVHYRWKNSWIDLKNDGMSDKEMIKGDTKKHMKRLTKNQLKRQTEQEIREVIENK